MLPSLRQLGIRLLVCDMAGTTVEEHLTVYSTLRQVLCDYLNGTEPDAVLLEQASGAPIPCLLTFSCQQHSNVAEQQALYAQLREDFLQRLTAAYRSPGRLTLMDPTLLEYFASVRRAGIHVALNTGYPTAVASLIVDTLGLSQHIDTWVCAEQVGGKERPDPAMIFHLMKTVGVSDPLHVAKVGDTPRDIGEGKTAGVGLNVGVLTGAGTEESLRSAGADYIIQRVTQMVP